MITKTKTCRPTCDLSRFEGLALEEAVDLLKAYMFQQVSFLGKNVRLGYSPRSNQVFLWDEAGHVAKVEAGELKQWATCRVCGFIDSEEPYFTSGSLCGRCDREGYSGYLFSGLDSV